MLSVDRALILPSNNPVIASVPRELWPCGAPGEVGDEQDVGMHAWIDSAWLLQLLQQTKMIIEGE